MSLYALHDRRATFLQGLDHLTGTERYDAFVREVREANGTWFTAFRDDIHTPHHIEIRLHGVIGRGATEQATFANWTQAAEALVEG